MKKLSKNYTHHAYYVDEVRARLVEYLNKTYNAGIGKPKIRGMIWRKRVSKGRGVRISSTMRDTHDNYLIFEFDPKIWGPWLSKERAERAKTLENLFPGFNFK